MNNTVKTVIDSINDVEEELHKMKYKDEYKLIDLVKNVTKKEEIKVNVQKKYKDNPPCPDCDASMQAMEGCLRCLYCGFALCK